ncbi:Protein rogdi-like protein, partial [Ophiophagus hannah]
MPLALILFLSFLIQEASHRFNLPSSSSEGPVKQENFILGSSNVDQVKGVLTLQGDALCQADINLKMPRNNQLVHFAFRDDKQWKLQQIQDARNHVNQAVYLLTNRSANYQFKTGCEVLKKMFTPSLPPDILVNFYINLNKVCLTVYQLHPLQPSSTKIAVFSGYWNYRPY